MCGDGVVLSLVSCGGGSGSESLFPSDVVRSAEQALGDKVNYLGVHIQSFPTLLRTKVGGPEIICLFIYSRYIGSFGWLSPGQYSCGAVRAREELP